MVSENDIEGSQPATLEAASKSWVKGRIKSLHGDKDEVDEKMQADATPPVVEAEPLGYDVEDVENSGTVRLPAESKNGGRSIPAVCTICLCPYESGEHVSWSPDVKCQHAFHKDCIISWLAKKDEPKCPICRQDFCRLTEVPAMVQSAEQHLTPYNFSQSLSRALALSRLEAAAMSAMEQHNQNDIDEITNHERTYVRRSTADEETGEASPNTAPENTDGSTAAPAPATAERTGNLYISRAI
jgi:hypothetical protein